MYNNIQFFSLGPPQQSCGPTFTPYGRRTGAPIGAG
ncbi:hypothetical protein SapgrDRAFT_3505, partial [Saprospira grandis DSM 2844]